MNGEQLIFSLCLSSRLGLVNNSYAGGTMVSVSIVGSAWRINVVA